MTTPTAAREPGRRERNKQEKRARILAAARARLAEHGYDRMTMADIARDADVAIGTVFQYAQTKAELLLMVTADEWAQTLPVAVRTAARAKRPTEAIRLLLDPVLGASRRDPDVTMAIARELLFGTRGPHHDEVVTVVAGLETAIADVLRAHGAGERAPAAARLIVAGGLLELNRTRMGYAEDATADARLAELIAIALDGSASTRDGPTRRPAP